jgi:hypothetical protein
MPSIFIFFTLQELSNVGGNKYNERCHTII